MAKRKLVSKSFRIDPEKEIIIIITGEERIGMSSFSINLSKHIDNCFNESSNL